MLHAQGLIILHQSLQLPHLLFGDLIFVVAITGYTYLYLKDQDKRKSKEAYEGSFSNSSTITI